MKIFSTAPDGNEMADMANARYFNLAIKQIEENAEWLKTANKPTQALLAHIEILIMLAKRFPIDANLSIKKEKVQEWELHQTLHNPNYGIRRNSPFQSLMLAYKQLSRLP